MRMAEQAEALKKAPPAQKVAQLKSCLAKPGSGEKKSNMYRLPDELPEHLTIQVSYAFFFGAMLSVLEQHFPRGRWSRGGEGGWARRGPHLTRF
eukprot:scaffold94945_cov18-Tisochrysis_lutea.AAC.1